MARVVRRIVECDRCDFWSDFFRDAGMQVLGCAPVGGGRCEIRMVDPALGAVEESPAETGAAPRSLGRAAPPRAAAEPVAPAELSATQVRTAQAIVNLFETGQVRGDYGRVTLMAGDSGHLSFGRAQTTLASGGLGRLVERYVGNAAARFAARLRPYLPRLRAPDLSLDDDAVLKNLLRASADDPAMRDTQDAFFDEEYWQGAQRAAARHGITLPLGVAIVYDGKVHGSWDRLRKQVDDAAGTPQAIGERDWLAAYVAARRDWLARHPNALLRLTVYRMDAFRRLIELGQWGLELPLVVRGQEISLATLNALPVGCYDGPQPGTRALALAEPLQRGLDVRLVQLGLSLRGIDAVADGLFGRGSQDAVRQFQAATGRPDTGVLDAAAVAELART